MNNYTERIQNVLAQLESLRADLKKEVKTNGDYDTYYDYMDDVDRRFSESIAKLEIISDSIHEYVD